MVIRPLGAAGVANYDVLVIGKRPDFGSLGRQRLLTEVGRHTDLSWSGFQERRSLLQRDVADDRLDIDRLRTGGNPAVDEHAIGVDGHFDSDQCIRLLPHGGGDDDSLLELEANNGILLYSAWPGSWLGQLSRPLPVRISRFGRCANSETGQRTIGSAL